MNMYQQNERKALRIALRVVIGVILLAVLAFGGFLGYAMLTDYRPEPVIALSADGAASVNAAGTNTPYRMMTYNIGYCGLGAEQDFFMEGGANAGALSLAEVETNLAAIQKTIGEGYDFLLLQEVDEDAKRSFSVNQRNALAQQLAASHTSAFGVNYKVPFVPVPVSAPMGHVLSGLQIFSKVTAENAYRYRFDGEESFPVQLFELDRCFVVMTVPVENGRKLKLINAHFSAYDTGGAIKSKQMAQMREFLLEQDPDDYIILGGDWNQVLPGSSMHPAWWDAPLPDWVAELPAQFTPDGYQWGVDVSSPTCRANDRPYVPEQNYVATIDGFLVSPNVEIVSVKAQDLAFENADHLPVVMTFLLKD